MADHDKTQKRSRGAEAYELIRNKILAGDFEPGAPIVESRLAETLGISRTPIREALFRLAQEGFATATSGSGFSVSSLNEREAREVYPLIAGLEVIAIEESGPLLATIVEKLVALNKRLAEAKTIVAGIEIDSMWHDTLISCCANSRLQSWVSTLRATVYRYETYYMSDTALIAESVKQHSKLIELIQSGEIAELCQVLKRHYKFGMEAVVLKLAASRTAASAGNLH
ncbi:GntR family transcriptional regulator [Sphingorhabdus sp. EL138]|uniref:GntR family transcriptional regulator n=1 Tax=Sphingorhabdus sp. EL138 TaxID=2073156 RepID=UPI000D6911B3|nr:GntR family transcriptional regulator [Sphingorhabdus sp. EL138]